jgi:hypothetical protein
MRTDRHRHVRTILAAIDRAIASPHNNGRNEMVEVVANKIIELGDTCEHFTHRPGNWTAAGMRAVVLAYALHAPERDLAKMVDVAEGELQWCEWWDREGADIAEGRKEEVA